jgi:hypothetical protein
MSNIVWTYMEVGCSTGRSAGFDRTAPKEAEAVEPNLPKWGDAMEMTS